MEGEGKLPADEDTLRRFLGPPAAIIIGRKK